MNKISHADLKKCIYFKVKYWVYAEYAKFTYY